MIKEKLEKFCIDIGLDTIGFISCREFNELAEFYKYRQKNNLQNEFEEENIKKRIDPKMYMKDGKTIISIAFPYYNKEEENNNNGFSIYTKGLDYHMVLKKYLNMICKYIETLGGKAEAFVDNNALPERYIAYLAGVGFIGRNNMIITKRYGSYVFLGEIITNLEMDCMEKRSFNEILSYKECNDCNICIRECPTKSINNEKINPNICLSYITQKKDISDKEINLLRGNIFGCDYCQLKCPYNKEILENILEEFKTLSYMNDDVYTYANMNNKFFKEKIKVTSCGWRGKNIIKRNSIINMKYNNKDINEFKGDSSYINDYIDRLTDIQSGRDLK